MALSTYVFHPIAHSLTAHSPTPPGTWAILAQVPPSLRFPTLTALFDLKTQAASSRPPLPQGPPAVVTLGSLRCRFARPLGWAGLGVLALRLLLRSETLGFPTAPES